MKNERQLSVVKRLIRSMIVEESDAFVSSKDEPLANASLDQQVDDLIRGYEESARVDGVVESCLREADDDEEKNVDDEIVTGVPGQKKLSSDSIDVLEFAGSVERLIGSFSALVEVERTVMRRAYNFLLENYERSVVDEFTDVMRRTCMLDDDESVWDIDDNDHAAPYAQGAGPDVSGGG